MSDDPSAADLPTIRRVVEDLCDMWERDQERPEVLSFSGTLDAKRAIGIHTLAHHGTRLARAMLVLESNGMSSEAVPTVRLIFECGITAAWLLLTPGSGDAFIKDGALQRRRAQEGMIRIGHITDDAESYAESVGVLDAYAKNGPQPAFQMEQRCKALSTGDSLYVTYRALSNLSHAGMGMADVYARADTASPIGLSFYPPGDYEPRAATYGIGAALLLLAINADEQARAKPRRTTQIARAAKRLGVGTLILRADGSGVGAVG